MSSLVSLIASHAVGSGGIDTKEDAEEQRTQTMMYAARMKYLQDDDQVQPDSLFMTRKQAQKMAHQDSIKMSLKKIEGVSGTAVNGNHTGVVGHGRKGAIAEGKNNIPIGLRKTPMFMDDRQQTWVPLTQAGCHFWQSSETGECRTKPPPGWDGRPHPGLALRQDTSAEKDESDDEPFPDAFAVLNSSIRKR